MNNIIYIIIAVLVLIILLSLIKHEVKRIALKDLNNLLLEKRNTNEDYYFYNEKTQAIYMIDTKTGELYICSEEKIYDPRTMKKRIHEIQYSNNKDTYKKVSDNYYDIIEKNISFDLKDL